LLRKKPERGISDPAGENSSAEISENTKETGRSRKQ
jgi:hypothetical protein